MAVTLQDLSHALHELRDAAVAAEGEAASQIDAVAPDQRVSARNLVHYLAVRSHDLRALQADLARYGLSSLGRMEARVLPALDEVIATVDSLAEGTQRPALADADEDPEGPLPAHATALLGAPVEGRDTRIMVTMPSQAAVDGELVAAMTAAGMDIARINCAHDGPGEWGAMVQHVRDAAAREGRPARIAMDLGGPKLRTGPIEPGPRVVKLRPARSAGGSVLAPSLVLLVPGTSPRDRELPETPADTAVVPLVGLEPGLAAVGDDVVLRDARGKKRTLAVTGVAPDGALLVSCHRTVYWETGIKVRFADGAALRVGDLPPAEGHLLVSIGDTIRLTTDLAPVPATSSSPHRLGCTLPEALRDARPGHRILFDDGKIEGTVDEVADGGELTVTVTRAAPGGTKLRAEKGINLPDTHLRIPALTDEDREHLRFVAGHADLVSLSFARSPRDVGDLVDELQQLGAKDVGIILKVETESGFANLPAMLLQAMRVGPVGVMIARGDLAVEAGFERLAEVQEEILWLCEAAHAPAVWATQVLDTLARTGAPSRSEVTDAAMGRRAECVMLNKGPFIVDAIEALDEILRRMGGHVDKKRSLLRRLHVWEEWDESFETPETALGGER